MTEQVHADLDVMSEVHSRKVNVSISVVIDFNDLANELRGTPKGLDLGELMLAGEYGSIETLAKDLSTRQRVDLIAELISTLSDSDSGELCAEFCGVCEERDTLSDEVAEIEGEQNG